MTEHGPVTDYEFGPDATRRATDAALERIDDARGVVLVEGITDQIAVETLAVRVGRDLEADGLVVLPIGGAHAIKHFVPRLAAHPELRLTGLVDRAEAPEFADAFSVAVEQLRDHGVFLCDPDLEAELIRALDPADLEAALDDHGDLRSFRTLQKQPNWRDRPFEQQMHRWLRSVSYRGPRYAQVLVQRADLERLPGPLLAVLGEG